MRSLRPSSVAARWRRAEWLAVGLILGALAGCGEAGSATPPPVTSTPAFTFTAGPPTATPSPAATATLAPTASDTPPPSPTATPGAGTVRVADSDGMTQLYVPAGEFSMGSTAGDGLAYADEQPPHTVHLSGYWIDRTEVTNAQFAAFVAATGYATTAERAAEALVFQPETGAWEHTPGANWQHPTGPEASLDGLDDYPVGQMSWSDAGAYCAWAGRRLPTEAEWEKAARGVDQRPYPWGGQPPDGTLLNFADRHLAVGWADESADDGYQFFAPAGSYPAGASPYGALDMAGNAWEWVADFFDRDYYARSPASDPAGPETGDQHVLRGGSWWTSARDTRTSVRGEASDFPYDIYGFRCAQPAE
jgi:formylglycine-generating enzyme required for sulfatase activity